MKVASQRPLVPTVQVVPADQQLHQRLFPLRVPEARARPAARQDPLRPVGRFRHAALPVLPVRCPPLVLARLEVRQVQQDQPHRAAPVDQPALLNPPALPVRQGPVVQLVPAVQRDLARLRGPAGLVLPVLARSTRQGERGKQLTPFR